VALPTLANIIWRSFIGSHAHLATGTDRIRRYARGYSPLIGYVDPARPDFQALAYFCEPGEKFYCAEWRGAEPAGWKVEVDSSMCAMVWDAPPPGRDDSLEAVRLRGEHVPQMLALTEATRPGPFGNRTIELGEWHGVFDGDRLIAMAGERLQDGDLHEISGVCTLPEYRGRGLAKRLTALVIRVQLARGEIPFLHVASANIRALELYRRMGFVLDQEVAMRVVSRRT
jgi:ribosomal protein S18 acetylase RimI-like enzyme